MASKLFSDQLREAVKRSGKTRYRISLETGILQSTLSRFVRGQCGLGLDAIDKLTECIGGRLVMESRATRNGTKRKRN